MGDQDFSADFSVEKRELAKKSTKKKPHRKIGVTEIKPSSTE